MNEQLSLDELVKAYLTLRNERERILADCEAKEKLIKADMLLLEQSMLAICNTTGADSIKTAQGTVMRSTKERFTCNDWGSFKDFVLEHEAIDLLERRIHQGNFKSFLSEHSVEAEGLPPGVSVFREFAITVRKPTSK